MTKSVEGEERVERSKRLLRRTHHSHVLLSGLPESDGRMNEGELA